jgi:hypothetical protein
MPAGLPDQFHQHGTLNARTRRRMEHNRPHVQGSDELDLNAGGTTVQGKRLRAASEKTERHLERVERR